MFTYTFINYNLIIRVISLDNYYNADKNLSQLDK